MRRETQSFYADCFYIVSSQPNQRAALVAHKFIWPRPALNLYSLVRRQELNSLLFSNPKILSPRFRSWRHPHPLVLISVWDFYFDISEWYILSARAWTPALMLHLTNPCAKRKVFSLTKPKGKIYKMKSLRNYITQRLLRIVSLSSCHQEPKSRIHKPFVSETTESACVFACVLYCICIVLQSW